MPSHQTVDFRISIETKSTVRTTKLQYVLITIVIILHTRELCNCSRTVQLFKNCSSGGGPHMTITHDALYLTVQAPIPAHPSSWHLVAITGDLFKLVHWTCTGTPTHQYCSTNIWWLPTSTDIWWPLKHIRLVSGQYASYGNAFLFKVSIQQIIHSSN